MELLGWKIKDTELCPCGSNKAYKECCKNATEVAPNTSKKPPEVQVMEKMRASMEKCCLYPDKTSCKGKIKEAHALQLEVLLEIHTEQETDYINEYVDMIGVNNRNLGTFHTDTENSFRLAEKLPKDKVLVSESGISNPETVIKLREAGFRGFLIGENFMKTENPGKALNEFINQLQSAL